MAKSKKDEQAFEAVQPFTIDEKAPDGPAADERDAKIAALEAEIAALKEAQAQAPAVVYADEKPRFFRVELLHAPTRVVYARNSGEAWAKYMERAGIRGSENQPEITECNGPCGWFAADGRGGTKFVEDPAEFQPKVAA